MVLPALLCAAIFAAGCGGGSGSDPAGSGSGPDNPTPPTPPTPPALPAPGIAFVDPDIGPPAGGTLLTILGAGYLEGVEGEVTVTIGGKLALDVEVQDDSTLTCITPPGTPELRAEVRVSNSRGEGVLAEGFTYLSQPSINTDLNGDGIADIVISARTDSSAGAFSGSVYVFYGVAPPGIQVDMSAAQADVKIMGNSPGDHFGSSVASGDVNGDGIDDLVIGASYVNVDSVVNAGAVYVFFGPLPASGYLSASNADVVITNRFGSQNDLFGTCVAVGDVNGDLIDDILVGATGADRQLDGGGHVADSGKAFLFFGSTGFGSRDAQDADVVIAGNEANDQLGNACMLADMNGDGLADLVIGAYLANPVVPPTKIDAGAVYVFLAGEGLASGLAADADMEFSGEQPSDEFGSVLASGDVNGDGLTDLVVSAPGSQALGSETGRVYVFLGASEPFGRNASLADAIYSGQQGNADFGRDLTCADLDGDGFYDVVVGSPRNSHGAIRNGRCFVFLGSETLQDGLSLSADVIFTGEIESYSRFASSLEVIDLDGDGLADVVSAALGNSGGGVGSGRVYVFEGEQNLTDNTAYGDDLTITGEAEGSKFGSSISPGM